MQDFESDFLNDGFVNLGSVLDKTVCHELVKKVYETRNFELSLDVTRNDLNGAGESTKFKPMHGKILKSR